MNEKLEKWVKKLNGFEYPASEINGLQNEMEKDGVIAIYILHDGVLEDNMKFRGGIHDNFDVWNGFIVRLTENLSVRKVKPRYRVDQEGIPFVKAVWKPKDSQGNIYASWKIETDLPHGEFEIFEDGNLFCVSVVVDAEDIKNWIRRQQHVTKEN